jgi:hypothetical protein
MAVIVAVGVRSQIQCTEEWWVGSMIRIEMMMTGMSIIAECAYG